jgi:hypothetical protein
MSAFEKLELTELKELLETKRSALNKAKDLTDPAARALYSEVKALQLEIYRREEGLQLDMDDEPENPE